MNEKKIIDLIKDGENLHVEFKQRFSSYEKIAKELIAFANTRGGFLFLGIDDDGSVYGVASEKSDTELLVQTVREYCIPPLEYKLHHFEIEEHDVIVVEIPESSNKPHRIQDYKNELDLNTATVYVRVNDKSVLASKEMIKLLQAYESEANLKNYEIGKNEKIVFEWLDNNESITVNELSKYANISRRRASRTLIKLVRANLLMIHVKDNGENFFTYIG